MNAQLRSVATDVRTLPRAAWFLFLGTFINRFGSFVVPFLVLYLTAQGYSATRAGAAVSSYGVGHIAASALGGYMTDRLGRRTTIVISMFSSALSMLALSQAREYYSIIVLTFLAGMTAELYRPASSALLADLVPSERRLVGYAMYRFAVNAGYAAGPAVAGLLARRSFQLLFFGDAITSLIYGIIAMSFLPAGVRAVRSASGWGVALRTAWKSTPLVLFLVSSFLLAIVQFQILTTIPLQVSAFGHSPAV